eukprot:s995_g4.t1
MAVVTSPLVSMRSLLKQGWLLQTYQNGSMALVRNTNSTLVHFKRNSVCATGVIRMLGSPDDPIASPAAGECQHVEHVRASTLGRALTGLGSGWTNYEEHHEQKIPIYPGEVINVAENNTMGSKGINSMRPCVACVPTTGNAAGICSRWRRAINDVSRDTAVELLEVRGFKACEKSTGELPGREVRGFPGSHVEAGVRGPSAMDDRSLGDGAQLGTQVLLACDKGDETGAGGIQFHGSIPDSLSAGSFGA